MTLADAAESVTLSWLQLAVSILAIVVPTWLALYIYRRDHPRSADADPGRERPRARKMPVWGVTLIVVVLVGIIGIGGLVFFFDRSPAIHSQAAVPSSTPRSTPRSTRPPAPRHAAVVQNVYDVLASRAIADLKAQGFTHVRDEQVCSNSVAAGRVRQVVLDNGAALGHEDEIVGESGSSTRHLALSTPLAVKVSDGSC